jgi:ferritin-like metal-binding protein YciE
LEEIFGEIEEKPQGKKCDAIEGILEEGKASQKMRRGEQFDAPKGLTLRATHNPHLIRR